LAELGHGPTAGRSAGVARRGVPQTHGSTQRRDQRDALRILPEACGKARDERARRAEISPHIQVALTYQRGHRQCERRCVVREHRTPGRMILLLHHRANLAPPVVPSGTPLGPDQYRHLRRDHMPVRVNRNQKAAALERETHAPPRGRGTRRAAQAQRLAL
jgi:hypothetical protein